MNIFLSRKSAFKNNNYTARAFRYALAMNAYSSSRVFELLPIAASINPVKGSLLDMMCGSGFVSQYLGGAFSSVDAVDQTMNFYVGNKNSHCLHQCDVGDANIVSNTPKKYDHIISLAGFHHLLPCDLSNEKSDDSISSHRIQCLARWSNLLSRDGRLIIADVPSAGQPLRCFPHSVASSFPLVENSLQDIGCVDESDIVRADPNPALFFKQFVDKKSITPHISCFETELSLSLLLESSGYKNIQAATYLTPWIFDNTSQAIWFLHHIFGIGVKTFKTPEEIPSSFMNDVLTAVNEYLGCGHTKTGKFWIGWKLFYLSGDKPS